jgi:hypothetical protein
MATALRTKAEVEHDLAFWTHEAGRVVCVSDDHREMHETINALLDEWERLS